MPLVFASESAFSDTENSHKTVRVGYYESENFQEGGSDLAVKDGYSYAYLHKISNYTGWEYEYVYGDWVDLYRDLLLGKIDMMAGITKSFGRSGTFLFPDYPMGYESHYIYKKSDDDTMDVTDVMSLNGKRIGAIRASELTTELTNWANSNNIKCDIVTYASFEERDAALQNGEVDALVASDNNISLETGFVPFVKLSDEEFYLAIAKGRNDLLFDLNEAAKYQLRSNPNWLTNLEQQYFKKTAVNASLTFEEKNWIREYSYLKVGYIEDYLPFCDKTENDEVVGIISDMSYELSQFLGKEMTPQLRFTSYKTYDDMVLALKNSEIDIAFPVYNSIYHSEQEGILSSDEIVTVAMDIIYKGEYNENVTDVIAVSGHSPIQRVYVEKYYPKSQIYVASDAEDCLKAVLDGRATSTIFTGFRSKYFLDSEEYDALKSQQFTSSSSFSLAVNKENSKLLCVLNKAISQIDTDNLSGKMFVYSEYKNFYSAKDFIRDNLSLIVFLTLAAGFLVILFIHMYRMKSEEYEHAQEEATYDALTNVRNKGSFMKILQGIESDKSKFALILIDVDNFKHVNDTYGHEVGDKALIKVAKAMVSTFRTVDYTFRIGGDEFAVIMVDSEKCQSDVVLQKIKNISESMAVSEDGIPSITLSVGIAFSDRENPTDNIFKDADAALYYVKENGRNNSKIY